MSGVEKFLVIETSAATGSWALFADGQCVKAATVSGRASGNLAPGLLTISGELGGVGEIIVGVGPGSFSGIRVGIASAQGLAAVLGCPVVPIRSTHALAWQFRDVPDLAIFADARRGQFFHTAYAYGALTAPTRLVTADELATLATRHQLTISVEVLPHITRVEFPTAENLGHAHLNFPAEPVLPLDPIYLHNAVK
ncbi:MAG: tRNA (adenosine(37)-N6)-threonylcarbamoyltransferase complex dimerization subunit type 1 TsaB [Verrucomicrobiales bacterium]|jgi:tRNA threonylcarbamoyladenosine biosynthesis protein TsaB|nr:tRNA (adenosine(37)-N6)-threonylcarbamoyltransferase complex dimerization subunit type 1 TsaB [Verrucomicrobiales bacterium]